MNILLNGQNILTLFGLQALSAHDGLYSLSAPRVDKVTSSSLSGVQVENIPNRVAEQPISLSFILKTASNKSLVLLLDVIRDYFLNNETVLSIVYPSGVRRAYAVALNGEVTTNTKTESTPILTYIDFPLVLLNPIGKVITTTSVSSYTLFYYNPRATKIYWGDGKSEIVDGIGVYPHVYLSAQIWDIVVDIDKNDYILAP